MENAIEKGEEPVTVFSKKQTGGPKAEKVKRKPSAFNIFMQKVKPATMIGFKVDNEIIHSV